MTQDNTTPDYDAARITGHFDQYGMREWNRLVETPVDEVSLYIHTHYLKTYIPAGARVLEIGAGAGRFTQILAELGAKILVADISPVQLELNERHAHHYGFAQAVEGWQQVDICGMNCFDDEAFDCVVAYGGPLSYALDKRDMALQECLRVLKPGDKLLLSVMSLWGSVHRHLDGVLSIAAQSNQKITASGDLLPETMAGRTHYLHMFRADELRAWLHEYSLDILALSASNCLSLRWDDFLQEIRTDEEKWSELLRMELEACAEAGSLNMGTHTIGIVRKR